MGGALPVLGRRTRVSRGMKVWLSYQTLLLSACLQSSALVQNLPCSEPWRSVTLNPAPDAGGCSDAKRHHF